MRAATANRRSARKRSSPTKSLRERLDEAEQTLAAIRAGQVDALVVSGPTGEQTLTIEGAAHPYFLLLDAMGDGAALLDRSGAMLFGNRTLGDMVGVSVEALHGSTFQRLLAKAERPAFRALLHSTDTAKRVGTFTLDSGNAETTLVAVTLSAVSFGSNLGHVRSKQPCRATVVMAILSDLTFRNAAEATRVRLLERLIAAEDDERRRIARELHDETGQSLTALSVGLRAILDMSPPPAIRDVAMRLRDVAAKTVGDVGRLARGLHPAALDDMGLAAAARTYAGEYVRAFGTPLKFVAGNLDSPRLAPIAAATTYRILQESLTNVARHARATKIAVELKRDALTLEVLVRDNGVGFNARRASDGAPGLGLNGMRERTTLLGGSLQIASTPGRGTVVRARIPVTGGASPLRSVQEPRPALMGKSVRN